MSHRLSTTLRRIAVPVAVVGAIAGLAAPALANTRGTAYAVGTGHHISKNWSVKVISSDRNVSAEVAAANTPNGVAARGSQFVSVRVLAYKLSGGEGAAAWTINWGLYGRATHTLYSASPVWCPDGINQTNSVFKGGHVVGNICFEVKKSDITAGAMRLHVNDAYDYPNTTTSWFKIV